MRDVREPVAAVLLLSGALLSLVAAIGMVRLPDLYSRIHAATKPASLGLLLTLTGAGVFLGDASTWAKLSVAMVFQLTTAPVAAHLVGRVAHSAGVASSGHLVRDDLAEREAAPGSTGT